VAGLFYDPDWGETKRKSLSFASLIHWLFYLPQTSGKPGFVSNKKARHLRARLFLLSGWQDSNLRPSGPKPDALTGLRYTPKNYNKLKNQPDALIPKNMQSCPHR
jgi:hypothetical protein